MSLEEAINIVLEGVIETIFDSFLQFNVTPDISETEVPKGQRIITGRVEFIGGWEGAVTIECTQVLGRLIAAKMFSKDEKSVVTDDMLDCIGELANMTGGNIKGMMPEECHLSMPSVVEGLNYSISFVGSEKICELKMVCEKEPMTVRLYKRVKKN